MEGAESGSPAHDAPAASTVSKAVDIPARRTRGVSHFALRIPVYRATLGAIRRWAKGAREGACGLLRVQMKRLSSAEGASDGRRTTLSSALSLSLVDLAFEFLELGSCLAAQG